MLNTHFPQLLFTFSFLSWAKKEEVWIQALIWIKMAETRWGSHCGRFGGYSDIGILLPTPPQLPSLNTRGHKMQISLSADKQTFTSEIFRGCFGELSRGRQNYKSWATFSTEPEQLWINQPHCKESSKLNFKARGKIDAKKNMNI